LVLCTKFYSAVNQERNTVSINSEIKDLNSQLAEINANIALYQKQVREDRITRIIR